MSIPLIQPWMIPPADRMKYEAYFCRLRSPEGFIDSNTARQFFTRSNLPKEILAEMWEVSDRGKDGRLDFGEFCVAMHILTTLNCRGQQGTPLGPPHSFSRATHSQMNVSAQNVAQRSPVLPSKGSVTSQKFPDTEIGARTLNFGNFAAPSQSTVLMHQLCANEFLVSFGSTTSIGGECIRPSHEASVIQRRSERDNLRTEVDGLRRAVQKLSNDSNKIRIEEVEKQKRIKDLRVSVTKSNEHLSMLSIAENDSTPDYEALQARQKNLQELIAHMVAVGCNGANDSSNDLSGCLSGIERAAADLKMRRDVLTRNLDDVENAVEKSTEAMRRQTSRFSDLTCLVKGALRDNHDLQQKCATRQKMVFGLTLQSSGDSSSSGSLSLKGVDSGEIVVAIAAYRGETSGELSFTENAVLTVLKKDEGWWFGKDADHTQGYFPAAYVRSIPVAPVEEKLATALFSYTAQNADEISFEMNDVVEILSQDEPDPDWFMGRIVGTETMGLVPANYLRGLSDSADVVEASSCVEPTLRQKRIEELVSTEARYLDDMNAVLEIFYGALLERGACTEMELKQIFSVWHDIVASTTDLVKDFQYRQKCTAGNMVETVGDILCHHLPTMSPYYTTFCGNQVQMGEIIREKTKSNSVFAEVLRSCSQDSRMKGLPLSAAYVKPMQRITKYPLLIKHILAVTPDNHPDFPRLRDALRESEFLCARVNEGVRATENTERLDWIQKHVVMEGFPERLSFGSETNSMGPRMILYAGTLVKINTGRELVGFLFNDLFLLTVPPRHLSGTLGGFSFDRRQSTDNLSWKLYKKPLLLSSCKLTELSGGMSFQLSFPHSVHFSLRATSLAECKAWKRNIVKAVQDYDTKEKQKILSCSRVLNTQTPIGCCRLIVLEGTELSPVSEKNHCDPFCTVSIGDQEMRTTVMENTVGPKWDQNMNFILHDLNHDALFVKVFDYNAFSPNGFLGRAELRLKDIYQMGQEVSFPLVVRVLLHDVSSGEVVLKMDLQLFHTVAAALQHSLTTLAAMKL